jgi:hypothetical protein
MNPRITLRFARPRGSSGQLDSSAMTRDLHAQLQPLLSKRLETEVMERSDPSPYAS